MELYVFARFHVAAGNEPAAEEALRAQMLPVRSEVGCLRIHWFRGTRDPHLFFIHSHWRDEAAFDLHATLPHTVAFLAKMEALVDQPREVVRTVLAG